MNCAHYTLSVVKPLWLAITQQVFVHLAVRWSKRHSARNWNTNVKESVSNVLYVFMFQVNILGEFKPAVQRAETNRLMGCDGGRPDGGS